MGKKIALLFAVDAYYDSDRLPPLVNTLADSQLLREHLVDYCGFDEARGDRIYMVNPISRAICHRPTLENAQHVLNSLVDSCRRTPPELVFFAFSGHGFHEGQEDYLCMVDSRVENLRQTALTEAFVEGCLKQIGARQTVMLLDMCRNIPERGGSTSVLSSQSMSNLGRNIVLKKRDRGVPSGEDSPAWFLLNACSVGQQAFEWKDRGVGIFTGCFCEALRGSSTGDIRGIVEGTISGVMEQAWRQGVTQEPFALMWGRNFTLASADGKRSRKGRPAGQAVPQAPPFRPLYESSLAEGISLLSATCPVPAGARVNRLLVEFDGLRLYLLRSAEMRVGRGKQADVLVRKGGGSMGALEAPNNTVSRNHGLLRWDDDGMSYENHSQFGTNIDGKEQIERGWVPLRDCTQLKIGDIEMNLCLCRSKGGKGCRGQLECMILSHGDCKETECFCCLRTCCDLARIKADLRGWKVFVSEGAFALKTPLEEKIYLEAGKTIQCQGRQLRVSSGD